MLNLFISICHTRIIYENKNKLGDCRIPYTSSYHHKPIAYGWYSFTTSSRKRIPLCTWINHIPELLLLCKWLFWIKVQGEEFAVCLWHKFLLSHLVPALLILSLCITTNWKPLFSWGCWKLSKSTIILVSELCLKRNGNASRSVSFRPFSAFWPQLSYLTVMFPF